MPVLFPQRQTLTRDRPIARPVVLARRARLLERLREGNTCNLPSGDSDGGQFGSKTDPRCGTKGTIAFGPGHGPTKAGRAMLDEWHGKQKALAANPDVYKREGFDAKKGQQPYDAATYTVTDPGTEAALAKIANDNAHDPESIADLQFAYMQEHEPAVVESARELQRYAQEAHAEFVTELTGLAETLGIDLTYDNVTSDKFLDQTNEAIGLGPIKAVERTSVKAAEYDGNVLKVKDMLRSTIVVDTTLDMADALSQLKDVMDISVKDNVSKPAPGGWRAYNVIARLKKSGMLVEVQITTREMMRAKREGHEYFAQARTMEKVHPKPAKYAELIAKQEAIYDRAWRASGGATRRAVAAIASMAALAASLPQV